MYTTTKKKVMETLDEYKQAIIQGKYSKGVILALDLAMLTKSLRDMK